MLGGAACLSLVGAVKVLLGSDSFTPRWLDPVFGMTFLWLSASAVFFVASLVSVALARPAHEVTRIIFIASGSLILFGGASFFIDFFGMAYGGMSLLWMAWGAIRLGCLVALSAAAAWRVRAVWTKSCADCAGS